MLITHASAAQPLILTVANPAVSQYKAAQSPRELVHMANSNLDHVHRSGLKPLAMRITELQFNRLAALRDVDGISMQEHVRRSIDEYLKRAEKTLASGPPAGRRPVGPDQTNDDDPADVAAPPPAAARPRGQPPQVVRR